MDKAGLDILKKPYKSSTDLDENGTGCPADSYISDDELNGINAKIQTCDYLNYVMKEELRVDSSTYTSMKYISKTDVEICGVPFPKGTVMGINTIGVSFNPNQWKEPLKFIPERFDPESDYYTTPGDDPKTRHPRSWSPFSVGQRSCPGQVMAQTEMKALLARILYRTEYSVRQTLLEKEKAMFGMMSQLDVLGEMTVKDK